MSAPWHKWGAKPPSPDFAARVARAARRDFVARRARKIGASAAGLALAAAAALFVRSQTASRDGKGTAAEGRARIVADEPRVVPGSLGWHLSDAWTDEAFAFPLPFAPKLPYHGVVVVHFAPAFRELGSPGYWSYVPIWIKAGAAGRPDPRQLEEDLHDYYLGLCGTDGHPVIHTRAADPASYEAHLEPATLDAADRAEGGQWAFQGDLRTVDCVVAGGDLLLNVEAVAGTCAGQASFVAYTISPRPFADPVWARLRAERRAFDCRHTMTEEAIDALLAPPAIAPPNTPAGSALSWVLAAIERVPSEAEIVARVAPTMLAKAPARDVLAAFDSLHEDFSPPVLEAVSSVGPGRVIAVVRSGKRDAPIVGREIKLAVTVDPAAPERIAAMESVP
jgi:hypothetical protein